MKNNVGFVPLSSPLPFKTLPSYPVYFKDMYGDIYDLTIDEKGIYFEMLFYRFRTGKNLPRNENELFKTLKIFKKNQKKIAKILLQEFFIEYEDFFINRRQEEELLNAHEKYTINLKKARNAASERWEKKRAEIMNNASSNATSIDQNDASSISSSNPPRDAR